MTEQHFIVRNPNVQGGSPVIVGTRITITRLLFLLKQGYSIDQITNEFDIDKDILEGAIGTIIEHAEHGEYYHAA